MSIEVEPSNPAPVSGVYEETNVLGGQTGVRVTVGKGDQLPPSPRGFRWRLIADETTNRRLPPAAYA
jgi:hypothetical protein